MTIRLPEEELRDAITSEDWDRAKEILAQHVLTVHRAIDDPPPDMTDDDWRALLDQQQAWRNELAVTQINVGQLLERVRKHTAGVRAYQRKGL